MHTERMTSTSGQLLRRAGHMLCSSVPHHVVLALAALACFGFMTLYACSLVLLSPQTNCIHYDVGLLSNLQAVNPAQLES